MEGHSQIRVDENGAAGEYLIKGTYEDHMRTLHMVGIALCSQFDKVAAIIGEEKASNDRLHMALTLFMTTVIGDYIKNREQLENSGMSPQQYMNILLREQNKDKPE